jgi:hypothetical protein
VAGPNAKRLLDEVLRASDRASQLTSRLLAFGVKQIRQRDGPRDDGAHLRAVLFSSNGPAKGSGLGLATVLGLVQQSAGDISVASRVGEGTAPLGMRRQAWCVEWTREVWAGLFHPTQLFGMRSCVRGSGRIERAHRRRKARLGCLCAPGFW